MPLPRLSANDSRTVLTQQPLSGRCNRADQGRTVLGGLKGGTKHHFCPDCLSWLYTVPEGMDDFVNIRSTMLADFDGHAPYAEFYLDEGLAAMSSGAVRSFPMAPDYDGFMQLLDEFAARYA